MRSRLAADGAPQELLAEIEESVLTPSSLGGRQGRSVFATDTEILVDRVLPAPPLQESAHRGEFPQLLPLLQLIPFAVSQLLIVVDRAGADLHLRFAENPSISHGSERTGRGLDGRRRPRRPAQGECRRRSSARLARRQLRGPRRGLLGSQCRCRRRIRREDPARAPRGHGDAQRRRARHGAVARGARAGDARSADRGLRRVPRCRPGSGPVPGRAAPHDAGVHRRPSAGSRDPVPGEPGP